MNTAHTPTPHKPEDTGTAAVRAVFIGNRANNVEAHISREELAQIATAAAHYERLHSGHDALVDALEQTRKYLQRLVESGGGCDHSVGICWCEEQRALDSASDAIKAAKVTP